MTILMTSAILAATSTNIVALDLTDEIAFKGFENPESYDASDIIQQAYNEDVETTFLEDCTNHYSLWVNAIDDLAHEQGIESQTEQIKQQMTTNLLAGFELLAQVKRLVELETQVGAIDTLTQEGAIEDFNNITSGLNTLPWNNFVFKKVNVDGEYFEVNFGIELPTYYQNLGSIASSGWEANDLSQAKLVLNHLSTVLAFKELLTSETLIQFDNPAFVALKSALADANA